MGHEEGVEDTKEAATKEEEGEEAAGLVGKVVEEEPSTERVVSNCCAFLGIILIVS